MTDTGASFEQSMWGAIRINTGGANDAYVDGLNKLGPYGIENTVNEVEQFNVGVKSKYVSTGTVTDSTYGGNSLSSDAGQEYLKKAAYLKTKLTDIRFYKNTETGDFFTADLANDSDSSIQIAKHTLDEADNNGIYSFSGSAVFNGRPATFPIHHTSTTMVIAGVAETGDTITDSTATFVTDGILVGDTIIIEEVTAAEDQYTQHLVTAVTETELVLDSLDELTDQATGTSFTLHAGRF